MGPGGSRTGQVRDAPDSPASTRAADGEAGWRRLEEESDPVSSSGGAQRVWG